MCWGCEHSISWTQTPQERTPFAQCSPSASQLSGPLRGTFKGLSSVLGLKALLGLQQICQPRTPKSRGEDQVHRKTSARTASYSTEERPPLGRPSLVTLGTAPLGSEAFYLMHCTSSPFTQALLQNPTGAKSFSSLGSKKNKWIRPGCCLRGMCRKPP